MSRSRQKLPQRIRIPIQELNAIVERTRSGPLPEAEQAILKAAVATLARVTTELESTQTTLTQVKRILFGSPTETTAAVLGEEETAGSPSADAQTDPAAAGATKLRSIRIEVGVEARNYVTGQQRVTMVPLTIRRKQYRKVMIPPPGERSVLGAGGEDIPMIRTLGKAFYWQKLLDQGEFATITDLARSMKLEQGWVAEVLRMTTLAPDIVAAILDDALPNHVTLFDLAVDPPALWDDQRARLR